MTINRIMSRIRTNVLLERLVIMINSNPFVHLHVYTEYRYMWYRIRTVFYPELDHVGGGYIGTLIHKILSHARLIGEGMPPDGYGQEPVGQLLPAANTDFLLTYLTYRFGWIVFIGISVLILIFIVRALVVCKKQKSVLGFLVSLAVILTFALQVISYIAWNLGFLLFAPVSLPLFSYGG